MSSNDQNDNGQNNDEFEFSLDDSEASKETAQAIEPAAETLSTAAKAPEATVEQAIAAADEESVAPDADATPAAAAVVEEEAGLKAEASAAGAPTTEAVTAAVADAAADGDKLAITANAEPKGPLSSFEYANKLQTMSDMEDIIKSKDADRITVLFEELMSNDPDPIAEMTRIADAWHAEAVKVETKITETHERITGIETERARLIAGVEGQLVTDAILDPKELSPEAQEALVGKLAELKKLTLGTVNQTMMNGDISLDTIDVLQNAFGKTFDGLLGDIVQSGVVEGYLKTDDKVDLASPFADNIRKAVHANVDSIADATNAKVMEKVRDDKIADAEAMHATNKKALKAIHVKKSEDLAKRSTTSQTELKAIELKDQTAELDDVDADHEHKLSRINAVHGRELETLKARTKANAAAGFLKAFVASPDKDNKAHLEAARLIKEIRELVKNDIGQTKVKPLTEAIFNAKAGIVKLEEERKLYLANEKKTRAVTLRPDQLAKLRDGVSREHFADFADERDTAMDKEVKSYDDDNLAFWTNVEKGKQQLDAKHGLVVTTVDAAGPSKETLAMVKASVDKFKENVDSLPKITEKFGQPEDFENRTNVVGRIAKAKTNVDRTALFPKFMAWHNNKYMKLQAA